ncbi:MAG: metalloregulator ArsR/SmtB family transcription factor [Gemmataceae bacterium]|nr:metalloregulator ArsR/SmtB family transcription factor [Gemmataceae bacterium]
MATTDSSPRTDRMFRAFSDRTRLRILFLLQEKECCVNDLVEILQIEQPSASRHLAYLRRSGLVRVRRAGQWSYYSLSPAKEPFHRKLLECLTCCFSEVPQIQADATRAAKIRKAGGCCPPADAVKGKTKEKVQACCVDDRRGE